MCFGGGGGGDGGAAQARADEMARQARIKTGVGNINQKFEKFDDGFFKGRGQAYTNFATPRLTISTSRSATSWHSASPAPA